MGENYLFKYNVDMVFCIDATASMRPVINTVKNNALNFYHDVTAAMERKGKHINEMRIRVIAFRDYLADGDSAMMTTDFFRLPEQSKDFERCVKSIHAPEKYKTSDNRIRQTPIKSDDPVPEFCTLPASVSYGRCAQPVRLFL